MRYLRNCAFLSFLEPLKSSTRARSPPFSTHPRAPCARDSSAPGKSFAKNWKHSTFAHRRRVMCDKDDLDLLIDAALASYADPGPNDGLEHRMLARIGSTRKVPETREAPRRRWLPWAVALPLTAGVFLVFLTAPKTKDSPSRDAQSTAEAKHDSGSPVQNQPSLAFRSAEPQN